jgi:hypothetical protein
MRKMRKVLVSCGDDVFMSTSDVALAATYGRAFRPCVALRDTLVAPGSARAAVYLDAGSLTPTSFKCSRIAWIDVDAFIGEA